MQAVRQRKAGPLREAIASIVTNAGTDGKKERIKKEGLGARRSPHMLKR